MPDSGEHPEEQSDLDAEDLAAIEQAMAGLSEGPPAENPEFTPQFPGLESWVNEFFVLTFARPGQQIRWCARWWDHPEAVLRLDAMWRTWEAAALDPVRGVAVWIRDYLDPNLAVLLSPAGPFADCSDGQHVKPSVLPVSATPPGWWSASHWWEMLTDPDR
jgi:hypothetical protein